MKSVLIIEDYDNIKNLYVDAFVRAGYEVETAGSGNAGLTKTAQREYDVIILDMLMLELSGLDFLKAFDAPKHPKTMIVVTSNLNSENIIEKATALGATKYLIKADYTPQEIVAVVEATSAGEKSEENL